MSNKKKKSGSCCSPLSGKVIPCNENYKKLSLQEWIDRLRNNPYFKDREIKIRYIGREN